MNPTHRHDAAETALPPAAAAAAAILGRIDANAANHPDGAAALLRSTTEIRRRANLLLDDARAGRSPWFTVHEDALAGAADAVADSTRSRYPDGAIPFHSRWRHFEAGGVDRLGQLDALLARHHGGPVSAAVRARAHMDLALVSVLLDAGAGAQWSYTESSSGKEFTRSEGLGVASFHAFTAGMFSSDPAHPLQADAVGLRALLDDRLAQAFQVRDDNPMVGLSGRATLLRRLGEQLAATPEYFGSAARPAGLFDLLSEAEQHDIPPTAEVDAHAILSALLASLSPIWPSQNHVGNVALGDCWPHPAARGPGMSDGWMPFHKLSQWLTYSLLEPFAWAGVKLRGVEALTGLPEYRNGGLMLDTGVLRLRDPALATRQLAAGDPCIVEWRALTVALLDMLAPMVRDQLGVSADRMPLACVLEGGTWAAGRALAQRLRNGAPPLNIESDGTVF